jgi:hypothetical protein
MPTPLAPAPIGVKEFLRTMFWTVCARALEATSRTISDETVIRLMEGDLQD